MVIEESILINSDIEKVWQAFTDLSRWNDWNTVARRTTSPSGSMAEGEQFSFTLSPFSIPVMITPKVQKVIPLEKIIWTDSRFGICSRHEFQFQQITNGVLVTSTEHFTGLPLLFGGIIFPGATVRAMTIGILRDLKEAAEKQQHGYGK